MNGQGSLNPNFEADDGHNEQIDLNDTVMTLQNVMVTSASSAEVTSLKTRPAVMVRGAYKSYGKKTQVLKNYNMTVMEGTIYSLLGSSGCGKTTILSAIVGLKRLDAGQLSVFGEIPGTVASGIPGNCVGHMPQEYSLYPELSIQESFNYYGFIYGLSSEKVKERSDFLLEFLNLPMPSRRINTLSGGQKRRVSLALAMIHEPKLLILDEPTVGVDHLLRESIWKLLHSLVANGKTTVIITTHYIEESRASSTIGLMRNGRLLTEKSPSELLQEYNVPLLEDIVLILSRKNAEIGFDEDQQLKNTGPALVVSEPMVNPYLNNKHVFLNRQESKIKSQKEKIKEAFVRNTVSFSRLKALVTKNFILLVRNVLFLLFNFLSPSLQIVVVCLAVGNDPKNLKFGVINHENPFSCNLALNTPKPNITDCSSKSWSCTYLDTLPYDDNTLNLIPYTSEEEALSAVEKGELWGYLSIPANFSHDLRERMIGGVFLTNESYDGSTMTFQMDMSSQTIGTTLQRIFFTTFQKFASKVLEECDYDSRAGELPLKFKEPVYGSNEITFREYLAPSILLGLLFFFPLCSSGISYITDKKAGTLDRSLVAGVTTFEVMVANLFTQTLVLFGQAGFAFLMLTQVFGITVQGSVFSAVFLTILIGIGGMSMGFLISTFCEEEIQAVLLAMGFFFPNFLLAGMVWPVEGMPLFLQYVGYLLPCTLACESMRSIVSRGWGLFHYRVWPGFASTIAWVSIYWILTILIHTRANRKR